METTQISSGNQGIKRKKRWRAVVITAAVALAVFLFGLLFVFTLGRAATGLSFFSNKMSKVSEGISVAAADVANVVDISAEGSFDPSLFARLQRQYVLRPEDLPHKYFLPRNGETPYSNAEFINRMGKIQGTKMVIETGRVDGWEITLKRASDRNIAPEQFKSSISVFESNKGASLALDPDWLWVYTDPERAPDETLDRNCGIGAECILFMYDDFNQVSGISTLRYSVVFRYKNVLVYVSAKGLEMEVDGNDVLDAARVVHARLKTYHD